MSLDDLVRRVAEDTFEALAFMLPMTCDGDAAIDAPAVTASVRFAGPFAGTLLLTVEQAMLAELAGNMLGAMDPQDLTDEQQADGLKELLNVICGNLLPELAGQEAVFDVLAPELREGASLPGGAAPLASVRLDLDAGRASLALYAPADAPVLAAHHTG
ncbi:MAG: chemotaxis protein CheX [Planctomycetes bacterium]|nr:chemotaxis protein CheX [Planctomycetota bacterium]